MLEEATEEEREEIERDRVGVGFASPNKEDRELTFEEASMALSGKRHAQMKERFREVDTALGMVGSYRSILGDWEDGAEDSLVIEYTEYRDFDELKYAMAWKGLIAEQKTVIAFEEADGGPHAVFEATVSGDVKSVRQQLSDIGIPFRSIVDTGDGDVLVVVFDNGIAMPDVREKMQKFGDRSDVPITEIRGHGEEFGDAASRRSAAEYFRRVIREYESRWPDRPRFVPKARFSRFGARNPRYDSGKGPRPAVLIGIGRRKGGGHG